MRAFSLLRVTTLTAAAMMTLPVLAQSHVSLLRMSKPIVDKDFYLFSALDRDMAAQKALAADAELIKVAAARRSVIATSAQSCKQDAACQLRAVEWTEEDILTVALALRKLGNDDAAVKALVAHDLRPSHAYILLEKLDDGELLARAWEICARGVNHVIEVYGQGAQPRYPMIDSISIDMKSEEVKQRVAALTSAEAAPDAALQPFYATPLNTALALLELNHRDEAGRHEPMEDGANKAAFAAIATTRWQNYPFTTIVVPGAGPSDPQTALSETGHKLCALAAEKYRAGKAPFILVSGGYVHPSQTRFSEAIEMKRALVEEFHIPESAIIADPHARHTTTNLRNASRLIFRYGIPTDRPALVVHVSPASIAYISGPLLAERCVREIGYVPYRMLDHKTENEAAFLPLIESLEEDPIEPLDP